MTVDDVRYPLGGVCQQWRELFDVAKKDKEEKFGKFAKETYGFFNGPPDFMWSEEYARDRGGYLDKSATSQMPMFRVQLNKISDAVDLYGPHLMHRYPQVLMSPVYPPEVTPEAMGAVDPSMMQQLAVMMQNRQQTQKIQDSIAEIGGSYINWLQVETKKKAHARRIITEAIVKGMGVGYTEMYWPTAGSIKYPRTRHISVDQYIKDPDAKHNEDVQWIGVEWYQTITEVARKFEVPPEWLSEANHTFAKQKGQSETKESKSFDMVRYVEVFSKNGAGARLSTMKDISDELKEFLEFLGDVCYMAIPEYLPFPLNLPPVAMASETPDQLLERTSWPTPFFMDAGAGEDWPVTELYFKEDTDSAWPISLFKPLIGEIQFVNWVLSFIADTVAANAHNYLGVLRAAAEDIQEQLKKQRSGPFHMIEIDSTFGRRIDEVVSILDKPSFQYDLWKMVSEAIDIIEKGSGITDLMYGQPGRQMRSAEEAKLLGDTTTVRPDDMAEKSDSFYSLCGMKEWQAAVWHCDENDVAPILGPMGTHVFINTIQAMPFEWIMRDYQFRLAAGSARKQNFSNRISSLTEFARVAMPYWQLLLDRFGIMNPYNAFVQEWGKATQVDDFEKFTVPNEVIQSIMQAQMQQEQGEDPEEENRRREEEHRQGMTHRGESHSQELEIGREKTGSDMQNKTMESRVKQMLAMATASSASAGNGKK